MVLPWRKPQDHWPAQIKASKGNLLFENQMHSVSTGHRAFAAWYVQTLGVPADANLTSASSADHILLGPVPTQPVAYRDLSDATVLIPEIEHVIIAPKEVRQERIEKLHMDAVAAAAGGNISNLAPPATRNPS